MKNIQIISKIVARELGFNEAEAERVNNFYWKEVRKKASSFDSLSISIKHLGTLTTSKRKLDQFIRTLINKIRNIKKSDKYKESTKALLLEVNYGKLQKALIKRNELAKQYYETNIQRSERIYSVNTNDIQECRQDIRSDNKPSEAGVIHAS